MTEREARRLPSANARRSRQSAAESLEDFELFRRQLRLAGALVRLRQAVVRLRQIGREPRRVPQLLNRLRVPLLVREQDAELEECLRELDVERDGAPEQPFNLLQVRRG